MLVFRTDTVIGRSLLLYGEWAEHELQCLRPFIRSGETVLDIGAHIGTHALAFSRWVGTGRVIAVEAQPLVSSVLTVNCLLNERWNVEVVNGLCSRRGGWTRIDVDYRQHENFGGISFAALGQGPLAKILRRIRTGGRSPEPRVPIVTLDGLVGSDPVSLVKLDIEGMELAALRGATRLLRKHRPTVYLEQLDVDNLRRIYKLLTDCGYRLFWLETQPFNRNNYREVSENIWWRTETGILAVREDRPLPRHLGPVSVDDTAPPSRLDARAGIFIEDREAMAAHDRGTTGPGGG
jgi:FkbM family methyltransferase